MGHPSFVRGEEGEGQMFEGEKPRTKSPWKNPGLIIETWVTHSKCEG
jgi:hypothetical protein